MAGNGGAREGAGRPKGAKNKATVELQEAAREYTPLALETLAQICENSENHSARVSAAQALLDRGYGKPKQSHEHSGKGGEPFQVSVTFNASGPLSKAD